MTGNTEQKFRLVAGDSDVQFKGIRKFDCGDIVLNDFLQQLKRQCGRDNINALVLLNKEDVVVGFVTASLFQLGRDTLPEDTFPYSLPPIFSVMKIPMIAIDKQYQRQGWGEELMRAILDYCIEAASLVKGIKGIYLDAKVESRSFYEGLDFDVLSDEVSPNGTIPMFITMDTLRNSKGNKQLDQSA